jgi:hypothetical protein
VDAAADTAEMAATSEMAAAASEMATPAVAAATTAAVAAASATMSPAPVSAMDFGDQRVRGVFRDWRRSRTDRRKCFCALYGRHHQHCGGRDAKRLRQPVPEIRNGQHG